MVMPKFESELKLSEDNRYGIVQFKFRNYNEADSFHKMINNLFYGIEELGKAAEETELWNETDKKW